MNVKRIVFAVLCVLLVLVLILTAVIVSRVVSLFEGADPTVPPTTDSTSAATDATEPSSQPTEPSSQPTESTGDSTPTESTGGNHVHEYNIVLSSQDPTCTDSGYQELSCSCGLTQWKILEKLNHSFGYGQTIAGNCTTDGCTRYTCSVCGEVEDRNVVAAPGHKYAQGTHYNATCSDDAYTEYTCTNPGCADPIRKEVETGTALGHRFGDWIELDGVLTQTCSTCGVTHTTNDLAVTGSEFHDATDGTFRVYEIHVGSQHAPNLYLYKITDYVNNGSLVYRYSFETGLTVSYEISLQEQVVIQLIAFGGQATIT